MNIQLVLIDPQEDFCNPQGALYVTGADQDSIRTAALIKRLDNKISQIQVTLDSHHQLHIAHPMFWRYVGSGQQPSPFTQIKKKNGSLYGFEFSTGEEKEITTVNPGFFAYAMSYVESLEQNGRYILCIWPPHCLIGTPGHNIHEPLRDELLRWERDNIKIINKITKGSNPKTEHYSAVMADVPDSSDPSTQLNTSLINMAQHADIIIIAGQALSHCVANTITDIANNFGEENISKFALMTDCCSNVPGFEHLGDAFVTDMTARGMKSYLSTDFLV